MSKNPGIGGHAPPETSRATTHGKRNRPSTAEGSYQALQKRIRVREASEWRAPKKEEPRQFGSNRFWPIRSSYQEQRPGTRREPEASRKWVFSSSDVSTSEDTMVVVSYNILGVENASNHPDLYHSTKYLEWNQRKRLIHEEINHYNASILCFQEVDRFDEINDEFRKDGFKGVHETRMPEACDGCAIFWKENMFSLLHQESIKFKDFDLRNNVAQFCILKMNHNPSDSNLSSQTTLPTKSRSFLIGNIHVLYNPKRGDIKLGQVRLFLEKAYKLSQEWGGIPVIIVGDFNCAPQSAIYQFLASSELEFQLHDRRKISGQVERHPPQYRTYRSKNDIDERWTPEEIKVAAGDEAATHVQHHLSLSSAYPGVPGCWRTRDKHGEPLATSYHSKFMGTVDYIWHTKNLVPVRVLETLPKDVLRRTGGLPTQKWGSDHLALVCELAFTDEDSTTDEDSSTDEDST